MNLQALKLKGTYCYKTGTRPPGCTKPQEPTIYPLNLPDTQVLVFSVTTKRSKSSPCNFFHVGLVTPYSYPNALSLDTFNCLIVLNSSQLFKSTNKRRATYENDFFLPKE